MIKPRLVVKLKGEAAKEFLENEKHPKVTKEQIETFREAKRIFKEHPF